MLKKKNDSDTTPNRNGGTFYQDVISNNSRFGLAQTTRKACLLGGWEATMSDDSTRTLYSRRSVDPTCLFIGDCSPIQSSRDESTGI